MTLMLLTLLTFMIVTAIVVAGYYAVTAESATAQRLRTLVPNQVTPRAEQARPRAGSNLLKRLLALVGQYGVGGDESSLTHSLSCAGIRGRNAVMLFLGARTLLSFGPALMLLVIRTSSGKPFGRTLLISAVAWAYGHVIVNYWLKRRARRRMHKLTVGLPDCLDLTVVCLEAGLGLNATIARVGEERSAMNDALGQEFGQVSMELREGRSREDALRALGERNGIEDLKSLAGLIIQSDKLGASMAKTLRAHADVLRTKRRQRAEEAARKLPIKMLFPLAILILPPLFVVTAGPAVLKFRDVIRAVTAK